MLMGLDAYELDRLLTRLALHNAAGGGRRGRAGRQARAAARRGAAAAAADHHSNHNSNSSPAADPAAQNSTPEPSPAGQAPRVPASNAQPIDAPEATANGGAREDYPASWPPHRANHEGDYEAGARPRCHFSHLWTLN